MLTPAAAFAVADSSDVSATIGACTAVAASMSAPDIGELSYSTTRSTELGRPVFEASGLALTINTGEPVLDTDCAAPQAAIHFGHSRFTTTPESPEDETGWAPTTESTMTVFGQSRVSLQGVPTALPSAFSGAGPIGFTWRTSFDPETTPGVYSATATFSLVFS